MSRDIFKAKGDPITANQPEEPEMDISTPIRKLNEALAELAACDLTEAELRAECDTAIDNALDDDTESDRDSAPGCWGEDAPFYSGQR